MAIAAEKENYFKACAYTEVDHRSFPRNASLISSHHFSQLRLSADASKLRLKCCLVPHGNCDKEKEKVRTGSSAAQFPVIRLVLLIAPALSFRLTLINIKNAYVSRLDWNQACLRTSWWFSSRCTHSATERLSLFPQNGLEILEAYIRDCWVWASKATHRRAMHDWVWLRSHSRTSTAIRPLQYR